MCVDQQVHIMASLFVICQLWTYKQFSKANKPPHHQKHAINKTQQAENPGTFRAFSKIVR